MARRAGPDGSCRPGCCWATQRWPARDWRWARRRCGCMRRCPARWAWPPRRWPCPCPSRAGRCCACPSRHAHPARKTACSSRPRTRRRCSARSNRCAPRWARAALDAVYLNSECNASIRQHRRLWGGTRNVLWLGLPLLELLSADACRAILAHECAHIAGRHGRYASRVYFARQQWQEAARQLARRKGGQRAAAALHELARATLPGSQPGFRARMRVPGRRGIRAGLRRGVRVGCPDGDLSAGACPARIRIQLVRRRRGHGTTLAPGPAGGGWLAGQST